MLQARIAPPWNSIGWGFIGIAEHLSRVNAVLFLEPLLCECHRPFRPSGRATTPTVATGRELPLADMMGQLDAALGHQLYKIRVRPPIGNAPTHAKLDVAGVESLFAVH